MTTYGYKMYLIQHEHMNSVTGLATHRMVFIRNHFQLKV